MNLHDRLEAVAGPAVGPTAEQAAADLTRGRRALRRRRTAQQLGASVFAVAALAAAVTYGTTANGGGATTTPPQADGVTAPAPESKPAVTATKLVAYEGKQPKGFTLDKVPDGWEVQGVTASALTMAPIGFPDQERDSFVGKIVVMLQSQDDTSTPTGTKVTVGGKPGVINSTDESVPTGKNLWVKQPTGVWMLVQIWDATGWTNESIAEFGAGIHVLKDAKPGRG
jgi:hypothetical protein